MHHDLGEIYEYGVSSSNTDAGMQQDPGPLPTRTGIWKTVQPSGEEYDRL